MKSALLDESVPLDLQRDLSNHGIRAAHAGTLGLKGASDHDLIDAAIAGRYDVLVTCDQSLSKQRNVAALPIGIVVVCTNNWPTIRSGSREISTAIATVRPGRAMTVLAGAHRTRYGRRPRT